MKSNAPYSNTAFGLWSIVALVPLVLILSSFIFGQWTWGLMDDHSLVLQASKSNLWSVIQGIAANVGSGRGLRFTYDLYAQIFYSIFQSNPSGFYIFHLLLIAVILLIWGYVACLLCEQSLSFVLLPAIVLSCKPFYEGFFYLSVQEFLGLFFLGLLLVFLVKLFKAKQEQKILSKLNITGLFLFVFFLIGSKETFVAPLIVVSILFFTRSVVMRWQGMMFALLGLSALAIGYAIWLKFFVQGGYTSSYNFSDTAHLFVNVRSWFFDVFLCHLPWILLLVFLALKYRAACKAIVLSSRWPIMFSFALYLVYLIIILPWRGMSYMAIPLAVFFALGMSIILSKFLVLVSNTWQIVIACSFLILSVVPASYELNSFAQYNHDTIYLLKWIDHDPYLKTALLAGKDLGCNALEPAVAIGHLDQWLNKRDGFNVSYVPQVRDILSDKDMLFYFYLTRYGDQDLSRLGDMWTAVFTSESWVVFRRNY